MVYVKVAGKYDIQVKGTFDPRAVFADVKELIEEYDYTFVEKGQESKPDQYGDQVKFELHGRKEIDHFADSKMDLVFKFSDCSKDKKMLKGNLRVQITIIVRYDYENKWQDNFFLEKLFTFYLTHLVQERLKEKYFKPIASDGSKFYAKLKEMLDLYT